MAVTTEQRRDRGVLWAVVAMVAIVVSFGALLVVIANDDDDDGGTGGGSAAVTVELAEMTIMPEAISAPEGGSLDVRNVGTVVHNLAVEGHDVKTADLQAGDDETLDLGALPAGEHTVFCAIPGHREAGMEGTLTIGSGGGEATGGGDESGSAGASEDELRAANDADDELQRKPVDAYVAQLTEGANTEGVGNVPMEPVIEADGTKVFELTASVIDWEVEPGKKVRAWAYNDMVPGPWIKVNSGDQVRVVLRNKLPQSTAIHFHGIETPVAMDGVPFVTQDPVKPDTDFTYEFTAKGPAMGMYHSHHHAEHQVPDGLLGVFQVDEVPLPADIGPVPPENQHQMVLNDAGVIGLSLNAKSFPATAPIMAPAGSTVMITYHNEGLQIHPMHLHGIPQLVVAKDGFALPQPYWSDVVNVAPGERFTVIVRPTDTHKAADGGPGVWAYHCHILNHAEREDGMFGMVTTFIVT